MNSEMSRIGKTLTDVVEAIHSVINVDVTIIDSKFNRLAATGIYKEKVGCKISDTSIFSKSLKTNKGIIVLEPRKSENCITCENKESCREFAQVCSPIILGDEVLGLIGLIAFDSSQRAQIINNKDNLLNFLDKMGLLIAAKVSEYRNSKEFEVLLNALDSAAISVDENGKIIKYNMVAKENFGLSAFKDSDSITKLLDIKMDEVKEGIKGNREVSVYIGERVKSYSLRVNPVMHSEEKKIYVFTLKPVKDLISDAHKLFTQDSHFSFNEIIGEDLGFVEIIKLAKKASVGTSTVLITGESGTGKEMFARSIHSYSNRGDKPFLPINCAAIPEHLLESELFGYEGGAFTGAFKEGKIGKFEQAHKGTIFLDEIGDMPIHLQAKLLRVLQDGCFTRVGGNSERTVDVRIIAATNKNLEELVKEGSFREDLFYRINVIPLNIIPLRERRSDIPLLVDVFIKKYNQKLGKKVIDIEEIAKSKIEEYLWPGNVRELENTVEYAINMCNSDVISISDLPLKLKQIKEDIESSKEVFSIYDLEKREIKKAVAKYGTSKEGVKIACEKLGIGRSTYYRKIKQYDLN